MTCNLRLNTSSRYALLAATVLIFMAISMAPASIGIPSTAFDPTLKVHDNGRRVSVTGTVDCSAGERVQIHVRITQRSTGAVAEGNWKGKCTGSLQTWEIDAVVHGSGELEAGAAQGVGLAVTSSRGKSTDAIQWLNEITLIQQ
jgi:hypothetical protein